MCFWHELPDWQAEVTEQDAAPATQRTRCHECHEWVNVGETLHTLDQREYECCRYSEWSEDHDENHVCGSEDGEPCDFGETFNCHWCDRCDKFRKAIVAFEEADGCVGETASPAYPMLHEDASQSDHCHEYFDHAAVMFPELAVCGYLDRHGPDDDDEWDDADLEPVECYGGEG